MAPLLQKERVSLRKNSKFPVSNPSKWLSHIAVAVAAFQIGFLLGGHGGGDELHCPVCETNSVPVAAAVAAPCVPVPVAAAVPCVPVPVAATVPAAQVQAPPEIERNTMETPSTPVSASMPETMNNLFVGMGRVNRDEFFKKYDLGVPVDPSSKGNEDIMLLYSQKSLPKPWDALEGTQDTMIPLYNATEATENCQVMKMILTEPKKEQHCLAIMGQWESYHVHKWMRLAPNNETGKVVKNPDALQDSNDMRYVSRGHQSDGRYQNLPIPKQTRNHWGVLREYLNTVEATLERLRPVAAKVAGDGNSIVVLVCNQGHSELLLNFACASRNRGLDVSKVLVFATDTATKELAESVGLSAFDVGDAFGKMPTVAAAFYGDQAFTGMMMAKVYSVHLINTLGYDLLFQDVDIVWYKNPLSFFESPESGDFDIYFQDDGAHTARYAPYSPNTGLYFVRNNLRTQYLLSVFVRMGDLVQVAGSHQAALTAVLSEHASWRGLKVKIFGRDAVEGNYFPGGFHFHRRLDFMKEVVTGKTTPYLFHMSWTKNKENKKKFFQQMGNWFVNDKCTGSSLSVTQILGGGSEEDHSAVSEHCCAAEPNVVCHFRDKPSTIPCKDSPPIVKNMKSFW